MKPITEAESKQLIYKKLQGGVRSFCKYPLLSLLALPFILGSCENDIVPFTELEDYYAESQGLSAFSLDSIAHFSAKVDDYVVHLPAAKHSPLYPQIQANIKQATAEVSLRVTIDEGWAGDIYIHF